MLFLDWLVPQGLSTFGRVRINLNEGCPLGMGGGGGEEVKDLYPN